MTSAVDDEEDDLRDFASPACLMHEVDPAYMGMSDSPDLSVDGDLKRWRQAERDRLIKSRLSIPAATRVGWDRRIQKIFSEIIGPVAGRVISLYWPFRSEADLRPVFDRLRDLGARTALPVVAARAAPLVFRAWAPGDPLEEGGWKISVPTADAPVVEPDIIVAPVVGFDRQCYRLGYGGGYFDRTLGALPDRPRFVGTGYMISAIPTIYPQAHDVAMEGVITEQGLVAPEPKQPADI